MLTSDKYLSTLRPFAYLFNKYWSPAQAVLVAGFTPPAFTLPDNFAFHSIGKYEDYPITHWSDALIRLLESIGDEAFVLMLEDYWLIRPVNIASVEAVYDYCRQFRYVVRFDLTTDREYSYGPHYPGDIPDYGYLGHLDLVPSDPTKQYHMSFMTAMWRRDNLLKVLVPNETPWQVEIDGTDRLAKMSDLLVLGTRQNPVRHAMHVHRGGEPDQWNTAELYAGDIKELQVMGFIGGFDDKDVKTRSAIVPERAAT